MDFFHLFDLAVLVVERQPGLDFSFQFILTEEHSSDINHIRIRDPE